MVKIQKKNWGGGRGRVRGGVGLGGGGSGWMGIEKGSLCENSKKKIFFLWGGWGSGWGGVRVDVSGEVKLL